MEAGLQSTGSLAFTGTTFQINQQTYDNAVPYNLGNYITLPQNGQTD